MLDLRSLFFRHAFLRGVPQFFQDVVLSDHVEPLYVWIDHGGVQSLRVVCRCLEIMSLGCVDHACLASALRNGCCQEHRLVQRLSKVLSLHEGAFVLESSTIEAFIFTVNCGCWKAKATDWSPIQFLNVLG